MNALSPPFLDVHAPIVSRRVGRLLFAVVGVGAIHHSPPCLSAQTRARDSVSIFGQVHDDRGRRLAGVDVLVNRREHRATTDAVGRFTIAVTPSDSNVGFRRIGYHPVLLDLRPLPPAGDTILVVLSPSPIELPEIIVSAAPSKPLRYAGTTKYDEVFLRKKIGLGTFLSREDLDRRFVMTTPELLQGIPGVRVSIGPAGSPAGSTIQFVRCSQSNAVAVYIDGNRQVSTGGELQPVIEMLNRINPADIEMIEVYRGVAQIPGVYHWDGCAVVAVWTKWNH